MCRKFVWALSFGVLLFAPLSWAQELQRMTANIGGGIGIPLSDASTISKTTGQFVLGGGANISRHFGVNSEFLWLKLPIEQSALDQAGVISANADELSLTVNGIARLSLTGRTGVYAIGGGGWYHRFGSLVLDQSGRVPAVVCGTLLVLLGANCVQVTIPSSQVPAQGSSSVLGGNIGAGITMGLRERTMKFYAEARYHHVPYKDVKVDHLLLTFGVRW
jgi:hypothetical protein